VRREEFGVDARTIAMSGVMLAFVFVMTRVPQVPIGPWGYVHLGDAAIYLASFLFGPVVGTFAAAVGTTASDLSAGYTAWAPGTFVIHGLQGLVAALIAWRRGLPRMVVAVIAGGAIVVVGYFLFQAFVLGAGLGASIGSLLPNTIQVVVGGVIGIAATLLVRRAYPPVTTFGEPVVWHEQSHA
jgi:energy-coupling factor transport system substrate-specific component